MVMTLTRRQALVGISSTLLLPFICSRPAHPDGPSHAIFAHGVASGDPDHSSVVLWTRVSGLDGIVHLSWAVATGADFSRIVAQGVCSTDGSRDFTVKVLAGKLAAGQEYFYRFSSNDTISPVGRTRTLPTGNLERLGIALASCSHYSYGYFNAYDAIANDPAIDFVVHLGDYIYEYGEDGWGGETGQRINRIHEPRHEAVTLADYRLRHAQYKTDQGSQAMHASHPLIAIWDDHDTADNSWMNGAVNHQAEEGDWSVRRKAALQAFYEWLPIREPHIGGNREAYWRHYKFGDLASLITLESRHTGRSQPIDYKIHLKNINSLADAQEFLKSVVGASDRTMLSKSMQQFLQVELQESIQSGRTWRLIANQTVLARHMVPKLDDLIFVKLRNELNGATLRMLNKLTKLGRLGLPAGLDSWNGYPAARERFYQLVKDAGVRDLLVLSGDSHSYWANALFDAGGGSMGLELGTTGITSPGDLLELGHAGQRRFEELVAEINREVMWSDDWYRGYIRLVIARDGARADFVAVTDVESRSYDTQIVHAVNIVNSEGTLHYV